MVFADMGLRPSAEGIPRMLSLMMGAGSGKRPNVNFRISEHYILVIFECYNILMSEHYSLGIFEYSNIIIFNVTECANRFGS
jgi:hypothetical protein